MTRHARKVSETTKKVVAARQGWRCAECNLLLTAFYEVDHITELWRGGTNEEHNLQALHRECHAAKGHRERERARMGKAFDALFERFHGGAYPLELASRQVLERAGAGLDTELLGLCTAHMESFPPSWKTHAKGGLVLQGVRPRSTRATH
jgi:hypothetical protein